MEMWNNGDDPVELSRRGQEVWTSVRPAPDRYRVSNMGRVISTAQSSAGRELGKFQQNGGYQAVGLVAARGGKAKTFLVHRLVIEAFLGPAPSPQHTDVRHKDRDKTNNRLDNIEWGTRSENMLDAWDHRRAGVPQSRSKSDGSGVYVGDTNDVRLLTVGMELYCEGKLTIVDLSRLWGCSSAVAANILHGKRKAHAADTGSVPTKGYRSPARKEAICALAAEGKGFKEINEVLGESLTAQDVYYYRSKSTRKG